MYFNSQGKQEVTYDAIVVGSGIADKFRKALPRFDEVGMKLHNKRFVYLSDEQKDEVLNPSADKGSHENIFEAIKALTVMAFFTSELGAKEVLKFNPIPGSWEACIPLSDVGGTWAI